MAKPADEGGAGGLAHGMAIVANDNIGDWLLPFLESHHATNRAIPLYLIPYDDNVSLTRRAAEVYGAIWVEDDMAELDSLARRLYPLSPYRRRRLRKLQSLALPLDRVIYLDVDIILFRDFSPVFARLQPGEAEFIIASSSDDFVYNQTYSQYEFLRDVRLFASGFFLTSRSLLSIRDFQDVVECEEKLFHAVRKRGVYDQPLFNFVVNRRGLRLRSLSECLPDASDESFYKTTTATLREDGPADAIGRAIYFIHWAGAVKTPQDDFFDKVWLDYAGRAAARMARCGAARSLALPPGRGR